MKKISIKGKLGLNKITISELNNQESIIGGAASNIETKSFNCFLTGYHPGCETYPCCLSVGCHTLAKPCDALLRDEKVK